MILSALNTKHKLTILSVSCYFSKLVDRNVDFLHTLIKYIFTSVQVFTLTLFNNLITFFSIKNYFTIKIARLTSKLWPYVSLSVQW